MCAGCVSVYVWGVCAYEWGCVCGVEGLWRCVWNEGGCVCVFHVDVCASIYVCGGADVNMHVCVFAAAFQS